VELVARIRAILRRTAPDGGPAPGDRRPERLSVDDLEVDVGSHVVRRAGVRVELTAVEFSLLEVLLRAPGSVVQRDELARSVLGRDLVPFDRSIDVHVSRLRKKLGPRSDGGERIKAVRAVGYGYGRDDGGRSVLGRDLVPFDRSIAVRVSRLRKRLGPRSVGGERIRAVRAVGYVYGRGEGVGGA